MFRTGSTKEDDSILWSSDEEAKRVAKNALDSGGCHETRERRREKTTEKLLRKCYIYIYYFYYYLLLSLVIYILTVEYF